MRQASQLCRDLIKNERQLAKLCVNLAVFVYQLLLLAGEPVFKVIYLPSQVGLSVLNLGDIQADDALSRVGLNGQVFTEICRKAVTERLKEVVEFRGMAAKHAIQSA